MGRNSWRSVGDGQDLKPVLVAEGVGQVVEARLHLARDDRLHGRHAALFRDVGQLDARGLHQLQGGDVVAHVHARAGQGDLAGVLLGVGHKVLDAVKGAVLGHDKHRRVGAPVTHRLKSVDVILGGIDDALGDEVGNVVGGQGVAVLGALLDEPVPANLAARAGLVDDHDGLSQVIVVTGQHGHQASLEVGGPARRISNDHAYRFVRIVLGHGRQAKGQHQGDCQGHRRQTSQEPLTLHTYPPGEFGCGRRARTLPMWRPETASLLPPCRPVRSTGRAGFAPLEAP